MAKKYDFSGWATKNDILCSDGRTIRKNAFVGDNGKRVPLVWNHQHDAPEEVLGHADLENREEGVYAYCSLNDTEEGQRAKMLIKHGDITSLSIFANQLKQERGNVIHGRIREVSLVLAGANDGAFIDNVMMHSDDSEEEATIFVDAPLELNHSGMDEEEEEEMDNEYLQHADDEETVQDVIDSMNEKQKKVLYALVGMAVKDNEAGNEDDEESEEGKEMKHNVFDKETQDEMLMHSEQLATIIADGKRYGSLKESYLAHADEYGIGNIEYLFPDAKTMNNAPDFLKREDSWVSGVMNSVHHTPFSRIKTVYADITEDEARAKGYIKGKMKKEEFFSLVKRTTSPTTIYKKQKLDRDDMVDITDFDVVSWLKTEMRMMLNEEIARAILVGDGRLASDDDKINEQNVRPIWTDADVYTIKYAIDSAAATTEAAKAKEFIKACIKSRKQYKGSGNPKLYADEDIITECLLLEDTTGRVIYDSLSKLATTLRVSEIVTVPVMEGLQRKNDDGDSFDLLGIIVNLRDYNVGADKGGEINMFDDFDIDYNQQKYLIETRISGALTRVYSAIAIEVKTAKAAG